MVMPLPGPTQPVVRLAAIYRALGLRDDPFAIGTILVPPAPLASFAAARERLSAWVDDDGPSLALVIGDEGSGRSTLLADLGAHLASAGRGSVQVLPVMPDATKMTDAKLLRAIIQAFGAESTGRTGLELVNEIRQLVATASATRTPLLVIDDVAFTGPRLELLRSLLAPPPGSAHPYRLRVLIAGTPDLSDRLARRRALAHQIAHTVRLAPLGIPEIAALLRWRIDAVRMEPETRAASPRFADDAVAGIAEWSGGNARAVILLAGECLLEAIARGVDDVDAAIVHDVGRDLTERARKQARAEAEAPYILPAVQTRLALSFLDEAPAEEPERAGRAGRKGRGR